MTATEIWMGGGGGGGEGTRRVRDVVFLREDSISFRSVCRTPHYGAGTTVSRPAALRGENVVSGRTVRGRESRAGTSAPVQNANGPDDGLVAMSNYSVMIIACRY